MLLPDMVLYVLVKDLVLAALGKRGGQGGFSRAEDERAAIIQW